MKRILTTMAAGGIALLPLVLTGVLVVWTGETLAAYVGPGSRIGWMMRGLGLAVVTEPAFAYAAGFGIVLAMLWGVGILVQTKAAGLAQRAMDATVAKVPLLGGLYRVLTRLVGLLDAKAADELRGMKPVWCRFGPEGAPKTLALLTTPEPVMLEGRRHLVVMIPTAPIPFGGALLLVPEEQVAPAGMGIDQLSGFYLSLGVSLPPGMGRGS
jgi:uncharacterized membrane protein